MLIFFISINPEEGVEKAKLKQVERISDDKEIQIVDGVQYQIEGQILKVYTGDSKMKPLNRHMGGLMMTVRQLIHMMELTLAY